MSRRSVAWGLLLTLFSGLAVAQAGSEIEADPGTVVRWVAPDTESCEMDDRRWPPMGDTCWYPLDLLRADGFVEVSRRRAGVDEQARIRLGDYPYPVQYITLEDESKVSLSAEDLERVAREQKLVGSLWSTVGDALFDLPLASPLRDRGSSGRFGSRRFFNNQPRSPHTGADYSAASGEPVFSVASGTVALAEDLFFSGKSVFLDHGDGLVSMYFHFSEILVEDGQKVGRGELIGRVGQTGRATGPHLHFGLRWRGARIDPELLLGPQMVVPAIE